MLRSRGRVQVFSKYSKGLGIAIEFPVGFAPCPKLLADHGGGGVTVDDLGGRARESPPCAEVLKKHDILRAGAELLNLLLKSGFEALVAPMDLVDAPRLLALALELARAKCE